MLFHMYSVSIKDHKLVKHSRIFKRAKTSEPSLCYMQPVLSILLSLKVIWNVVSFEFFGE